MVLLPIIYPLTLLMLRQEHSDINQVNAISADALALCNAIDCVTYAGYCLPWGKILTACAISVSTISTPILYYSWIIWYDPCIN